MSTTRDLYLLDLDGLLVRTEELHFAAYRGLCAARGLRLEWDFPTYCLAAHYGQEALREALRRDVPGLFTAESRWEELHAEKSRLYLAALEGSGVELQPGAEQLLARLAAADRRCVVVTNSTRDQCARLRRRLAALAEIAEWVAREDYRDAKPAPDAYLEALGRFGVPPARAIGLEDTPRGVEALTAAGIDACLVSRVPYPATGAVARARRYPDLPALLSDLLGSGME